MISVIKKLIPIKVKNALRNFALSGDNVECPVCEKTFITFLPFGVPPSPLRPNAMCPNCNSLERTRIYWKYLSSKKGFFDLEKNTLHVAPEPKLFEKFSSNKHFNYFPVDRFTKGYQYPEGTINMDITAMDFPDNHFDFILCSHVLEHIPEDKKAMRELYRVLKPGAWGILQVPIDLERTETYEDNAIKTPEEREKAFGQFDHVRIYGTDYIDRLKSVGFNVTLDNYANEVSESDKFKFGFGSGEELTIVYKIAGK